MQTPTSLNTLNFLTVERLLGELEENFPPINPKPDTPINQIMYRAGEVSVVDWIRNRISED